MKQRQGKTNSLKENGEEQQERTLESCWFIRVCVLFVDFKHVLFKMYLRNETQTKLPRYIYGEK